MNYHPPQSPFDGPNDTPTRSGPSPSHGNTTGLPQLPIGVPAHAPAQLSAQQTVQHPAQQPTQLLALPPAQAAERPATNAEPPTVRSFAPAEAPPPAAPTMLSETMTPAQRAAYIASTKVRASRKKPRPSLDKYRELLRECVEGEAVLRRVFDDLTAIDPAVREEFGPDGHRAFSACVKRMFK